MRTLATIVAPVASLALAICLPYGGLACSRLGPTPVIEPVSAEIKATPKVVRILVEPTSNTGSSDPAADVNRIVPAGAYGRYGDAVVLNAALDRTLRTLKLPVEVAPLLAVGWQTAFDRWVLSAAKAKPGKPPRKAIEPPEAAAKPLAKDADFDRLSEVLSADAKRLATLQNAIKTGETAKVLAAMPPPAAGDAQATAATAKVKALRRIETLNRHLIGRLDVTYVLVSHLDGDEEDFANDVPLTLHVALVNAKTGKFRYYAKSTARKSDLPTAYTGLLSYMAKNMFDDLADADRIDL